MGSDLVSDALTACGRVTPVTFGGVEWSELDYLEQPSVSSMPILVFQGIRDETVPIATSDELKRLVPHTQLVRCPGAGHIESWDLDPQAYESKMISFLDDATS